MSRLTYNLTSVNEFAELIKSNDETKEINILNKNISTTKNNQKYYVVRYNKNLLTNDTTNTFGLFRSVVLNSVGQVVSFAPPKSVDANEFMEKYKLPNEHIIAEEFIEGTMINVFWDPSIGITGGWEITTRNTVGAESGFYKKNNSKTFRNMFMDAIRECGLNIENMDKTLCYSFVLQHPENRIVVPFNYPCLYLVAVYHIERKEDDNVIVTPYENNEICACVDWYNTNLFFPSVIANFNNYEDMIERYASKNTPYNVLGIIFKNTQTGERCKVRNPNYEEVRRLRGNQPKSQYQYLCLRNTGSVKEFLKFYPEFKNEFNDFKNQLHSFTIILYQNYVSCYIKKEKPLGEFSEQFKTHMFNIHQKYLNELKEKKQHVTNTVVINYVNHLHPNLLMHSLNYNLKKYHADKIRIQHLEECIPSEVVL